MWNAPYVTCIEMIVLNNSLHESWQTALLFYMRMVYKDVCINQRNCEMLLIKSLIILSKVR